MNVDAIVGAAIAIGARELWDVGKAVFLDRRGRALDQAETHVEKIHAADVRFAEMQGLLNGWEIRFAIAQSKLSELDKLKKDVDAAHSLRRELELEVTRLSEAVATAIETLVLRGDLKIRAGDRAAGGSVFGSKRGTAPTSSGAPRASE